MSYQKFLILDFQVQRIQAHGSESASYELISQIFVKNVLKTYHQEKKLTLFK